MSRTLIAYYSFSGTTRCLAEEIARQVNGEVWEIIPEQAYTFAENTATKRVRGQIEQRHCPPNLAKCEAVQDFDTIFLGSPNWFKTMAPPVRTFICEHDLAGKTIVPFCTHGGGGLGCMEVDMREVCTESVFLPGMAPTEAPTAPQVAAWLERLGLMNA